MDAFAIDPIKVQDISSRLLDDRGRLRITFARTLEVTTAQEAAFWRTPRRYSLPTDELCDFLRSRIEGRVAIEIGAGHGLFADALSVPATDSRQQEDPEFRAYYSQIGQPKVPTAET